MAEYKFDPEDAADDNACGLPLDAVLAAKKLLGEALTDQVVLSNAGDDPVRFFEEVQDRATNLVVLRNVGREEGIKPGHIIHAIKHHTFNMYVAFEYDRSKDRFEAEVSELIGEKL